MNWEKTVGKKWYNLLKEVLEGEEMKRLMSYLHTEYKGLTICPDAKDIFKAFRLTDPHNLKVIILGLDPYNDGKSATGLAFANPDSAVRLSPSLEKIRDCIEETIYDGIMLDFDNNLEYLAEQGVLLLNTALTVRKNTPGSHKTEWEFFTNFVIKKINESFTGLHFCFWGNEAKSFKSLVNEKFHYTYEYVHPAYAARNKISWKCKHFKEVNENIKLQNKEDEIIIW